MFMRFAVGFGLGGTTVPFYTLAEFVPHQYRAQALLKLALAWSLGSFMVPVFAAATIDQSNKWPILLILCSLPSCFSFCFGLVVVPESPWWLRDKGQNDHALSVLRNVAVINEQDPGAVCPGSSHLIRGRKTNSKWKAVGRIFKKEWRGM